MTAVGVEQRGLMVVQIQELVQVVQIQNLVVQKYLHQIPSLLLEAVQDWRDHQNRSLVVLVGQRGFVELPQMWIVAEWASLSVVQMSAVFQTRKCFQNQMSLVVQTQEQVSWA